MSLIYHITTRDAWQNAQETGEYRTPSLDSEGFIHNSAVSQIVRVANNLYRGVQDLVILCINPTVVTANIIWEAPIHPDPNRPVAVEANESFPHIYGALNLNAVVNVVDFPEGTDGFTLPQSLPE